MVFCSGGSDAGKELDFQHPSPVSIFEASFSNETCNSSESWESTNGKDHELSHYFNLCLLFLPKLAFQLMSKHLHFFSREKDVFCSSTKPC